MDPKATVCALMDSIQQGDFTRARTLMSEDFRYIGSTPESISGDAWLAMAMSLKNACPDLDYHFHLENMCADTARISIQLRGTHTGAWDLTSMHMGKIRATRKSFAAAREDGKVTVKGDQVTSWVVQPTRGAGLKAIFGQLGLHPPAE
jgi:hypothetical protein